MARKRYMEEDFTTASYFMPKVVFLTFAIVTQVAAKPFKLYPSTIKDLWTSNPLKSTKSYYYIIKTVCYVSFIFTLVTNSTHRLLWFQPIKVSLTC